MSVRAVAAEVIYDVIVNGRSLADSIPKNHKEITDSRDQGLLQALCFGVCRWYYRLDAIANELLERPIRERDLDIYFLLLVGLYQLTQMRVPAYAAVAETVSASRYFKKPWAKGFLNGILREFQRTGRLPDASDPVAFYSHPRWLIERVEKNYPEFWEDILEENNEHPPFSLRVNCQKITREDYLAKLAEQDIEAHAITATPTGIVITQPMPVHELPGFAQGEVTVQDGAGQLAAGLLLLEPQQVVLDACAAPGGKTTHIMEMQPDVECIAVDVDADRVTTIQENLQRLGLTARCVTGNAEELSQCVPDQLFDRILLDAPCSASGVIRRHPDIKQLRRESDIKRLGVTQARLLASAWHVLKPNGILLYATCSIFPEENTDVLKAFLNTHPDAKEKVIDAQWGEACEIGRQILPGMQGMDGFYFARLQKES